MFSILFESIPEGVLIIDQNEKILEANESAKKMFELKNEELISNSFEVLLPKSNRHKYKRHFAYFLQTSTLNKKRSGIHLTGIKSNFIEFPLELSLNPIHYKNKIYAIALLKDISYRKKQETKIKQLNASLEKKIQRRTEELSLIISQLRELNENYRNEIKKRVEAENKIKNALKKEQELNELKTKFLSLVSHEFKTPLSGILTSAILLGKYNLQEQQPLRDKHIGIITKKVQFLNAILNDFLSIERLDSNNLNYRFTKFKLKNTLKTVVNAANLVLKQGQQINVVGIDLDFDMTQDEKVLELILLNLIYNSIKFSPENSPITLEVLKSDKCIIFKVIDSGIGIPLKDQKHIFNRYFRAENVLNTQGTGIGLNIVKAHLENLGGTISFSSIENVGSQFIVELSNIEAS